MGRLVPEDIGLYVKCPKLYQRRNKIAEPLTFFEAMMRDAFIEGERNAVLKDSIVDTRKFSRSWDKIFFPAVAKRNISMRKANKKTLAAIIKFADYCKYDISDYSYPTVGVDIQSRTEIGTHSLIAQADLLKIDLTTKYKTTVIVNFTNESFSGSQIAFDPRVRATAYAFYRNRNDYVMYVNVNVNEKNEKLEVITATFAPKDMDEIRKMIYHVELGIRNKAFFHNPYMCKGCNQCPNFS